jgi:uncharacterized protein
MFERTSTMTPKQPVVAGNTFVPQMRPWWKEPYVWMVIAGPVFAVVACIITAFYIMLGPDSVVSEDRFSAGIAINQQANNAQPSMQPAKTGRNHSATGGKKNEHP